MFYSYVFNTFLPKMTNFLRFFTKIIVFISYPQAPLRSVHAVTEIASSRRITHPLIRKHGACGYRNSVLQTHRSFSHPQAPLRSVHAATDIASSRRGDAYNSAFHLAFRIYNLAFFQIHFDSVQCLFDVIKRIGIRQSHISFAVRSEIYSWCDADVGVL